MYLALSQYLYEANSPKLFFLGSEHSYSLLLCSGTQRDIKDKAGYDLKLGVTDWQLIGKILSLNLCDMISVQNTWTGS